MYKTLSRKIKELEENNDEKQDKPEVQLKIQNYKEELDRIKKMFPENFFDS